MNKKLFLATIVGALTSILAYANETMDTIEEVELGSDICKPTMGGAGMQTKNTKPTMTEETMIEEESEEPMGEMEMEEELMTPEGTEEMMEEESTEAVD
jgi:hypothetical protein